MEKEESYEKIFLSGAELIAMSGTLSVKLADCLSIEELCTLIEFLGLLRHHLEVIKQRKFLKKIEKKFDDKKSENKKQDGKK